MTTRAQINSRVQTYLLDVPSAVSSEIPTIINAVIKRAMQRHNFRCMEETQQFTTTEATRKLGDKPSDWKESRGEPWLTDVDGFVDPIQWMPSLQDAVRAYDDNSDSDKGEPDHILEQATELWVYPYPDAQSTWSDKEYRVTVPYWKYLASLATTSSSNWFTDNAEDYVVFATVGDCFALNFDEVRHTFWGLTYDQLHRPVGKAAVELQRLIRVDKLSKLQSGLHLRPRADVRGTILQRRR